MYGELPEDTCNTRYSSNKTVTYILYAEYAGIPDNLIINVIAWVVLLFLFTILRKIAWDYGRIALVSRTEENSPVRSAESGYNVYDLFNFSPRVVSIPCPCSPVLTSQNNN